MIFPSYLLIVAAAWLITQGAKYILEAHKDKNTSFKRVITESGGMPSSHSAVVIAVTTLIMFNEGINSAIFGLAFTFAMIVIYDSMKVRYSTGIQSIVINKIIDEQKLNVPKLRVVKGHTPLEVAVGAAIGFMIGYAAFLIGM